MTNKCKDKLKKALTGCKSDKKIAEFLLKKERQFTTINELSALSGISSSTIHRFSQKNNFHSFKHLVQEYSISNSQKENTTNKSIDYEETVKKISIKMENKIHIVTSFKTRGVGILVSDQLRTYNIDNKIYDKNEESIAEFIKNIKNDESILLITLSGESKIISDVLSEISKIQRSEMPSTLLITGSEDLGVFAKYDFFEVLCLKNKYKFSNLKSYIDGLADLTKLSLHAFYKIYKK